ncbi:MAG TPA: Fe(3+) ABC transporter substrate-binding protein [Rhodospirillales bacterium]|nr:Fe(3+) ABC transporter substrate-binding protein [Rhodospirillales bacterium]
MTSQTASTTVRAARALAARLALRTLVFTAAAAFIAVVAGLVLVAAPPSVLAAEAAAGEVNIYSSRHYQSDEKLYAGFTEATGIKVNRIEGTDDALIERIRNEGANSPADVLITVDAGRLWRAEQAGILQPVSSEVLAERIQANLRDPNGQWFGFSQRARVIVYNKAKVDDPKALARYEDLADPRWKGRVCIRSGSNIYNLSLLSALIEELGEEQAERWAEGVVANFARPPQGGDTDQIKAVAAGECDVALANTYYFVRLMRSNDAADREIAGKLAVVFPNQQDRGTHVNISGAGVARNAPNKEQAVRFLDYLAGDEAQRHFAEGNNEYPVVAGIEANEALLSLGSFKIDPINVAVYGKNQAAAQKIFDRAGWK